MNGLEDVTETFVFFPDGKGSDRMVLFDFPDGKYEHVIYLFQLLILYTDPSKSSLLFSLSVSKERVTRNLVFH